MPQDNTHTTTHTHTHTHTHNTHVHTLSSIFKMLQWPLGEISSETLWTAACVAYAYAACVVLRAKVCVCVVDRLASEKDVGSEAALLVAQVVRAKPNARILFLTGSTPIRSGFFATLRELHEKSAVDFSKMRVVGGDEVRGRQGGHTHTHTHPHTLTHTHTHTYPPTHTRTHTHTHTHTHPTPPRHSMLECP